MFALTLSATHIIQSGGLWLVAGFVFVEVGLFLGFFLPGDTLLIAAGIYAKQGKINIALLILVATIAAIAGDNLAYWIGRKIGRRLFTNPDSVIFDPKHIATTERFYARYGSKTLLISHALPVVRSFTPLIAGIAEMPYRRFAVFNAIGDIVWAVGVTLLGFYVGSRIPNIDHYILAVVALAVILTAGPTIIHVIRLRMRKNRTTHRS